jgi:hypothetical protein
VCYPSSPRLPLRMPRGLWAPGQLLPSYPLTSWGLLAPGSCRPTGSLALPPSTPYATPVPEKDKWHTQRGADDTSGKGKVAGLRPLLNQPRLSRPDPNEALLVSECLRFTLKDHKSLNTPRITAIASLGSTYCVPGTSKGFLLTSPHWILRTCPRS